MSGPVIDKHGIERWYDASGKLHRDDGPAYINRNATSGVCESWFCHGELHREDGPAVIEYSGWKTWYFNGKRHRADGPAAIYTSTNRQLWYWHGKMVSEKTFLKLSNSKDGEIVDIDGKQYRLTLLK